jgi:hypothetical protein
MSPAQEHDFAELLADVDSEDAAVYMPHRDDDLERFVARAAQEGEN